MISGGAVPPPDPQHPNGGASERMSEFPRQLCCCHPRTAQIGFRRLSGFGATCPPCQRMVMALIDW